jgi:hypothetical protein
MPYLPAVAAVDVEGEAARQEHLILSRVRASGSGVSVSPCEVRSRPLMREKPNQPGFSFSSPVNGWPIVTGGAPTLAIYSG